MGQRTAYGRAPQGYSRTEHAERIHVIADGSQQVSAEGNFLVFDLANVKTYCRIEAHSEDDSIFSNPIMVIEKKKW